MIRRSPAERYIKYLIVHPKKYTNKQIEEILKFAQLDFLGGWYVEKLRSKLHPPNPFRPFDSRHDPSQTWLLVNGLSWIFKPDKHGKRAFDILESPRVKEYVESNIISNAPHVAIAHALTKYYRFPCETAVIDRYRDFFWNVDLVDSTELRALLALRIDKLESDLNPEVQAQHKSMKTAFWKDARKTASEMPFSPVGAFLSQLRMGIMPAHIDSKKLIEMCTGLSLGRAIEAMINNGPGDAKRSLDYAAVFEKMVNVGKEMTDPEDQMREQLASVAMRTDDTPLPSIHTLSLGQHTAEVAKMETTDELPADFVEGDGGDEPSGEPE